MQVRGFWNMKLRSSGVPSDVGRTAVWIDGMFTRKLVSPTASFKRV